MNIELGNFKGHAKRITEMNKAQPRQIPFRCQSTQVESLFDAMGLGERIPLSA